MHIKYTLCGHPSFTSNLQCIILRTMTMMMGKNLLLLHGWIELMHVNCSGRAYFCVSIFHFVLWLSMESVNMACLLSQPLTLHCILYPCIRSLLWIAFAANREQYSNDIMKQAHISAEREKSVVTTESGRMRECQKYSAVQRMCRDNRVFQPQKLR